MPFPESHGPLCFRAILLFCPAASPDSPPIKPLDRYTRSRENNTFLLPPEGQVVNEKRQIRRSCLMFNLFIECDFDLIVILGWRMALLRSDQCPCWADYTKVNSECIDMNSVLLWVLLAVCIFTSFPVDGSWTRIWEEQWQTLLSFHHAPCITSVLRVWEDEANQLRILSGDGWPRGMMAAPSPGRSSTQERDICSRSVWTFLLKSDLFALWGFGMHFGCVVREAPEMPWERGWSWGWTNWFLCSVTHSLAVFEEPSRRRVSDELCYVSWIYHLLFGLVYLSE